MEYKYHLLKYRGKHSRLTCPACGRHHCFTPYVDSDEQIVGNEYGRCDHESSCGYVKYPPTESNWREYNPSHRLIQHHQAKSPASKPRQLSQNDICTIPMHLVLKTVRTNPLNNFLRFLTTIATTEEIQRAVKEYYIGVAKGNAAVFYQIDSKGRCRTGKVMKYDPRTGHRIKDSSASTPITWVHSLLKQQGVLPKEWELTQCLFGEHLISRYPDKPVALVESEKTAIICSILNPECIWLATGGKGQLNDRVEMLAGRQIIAFPDVDGYEVWKQKADERLHIGIIVSDLLEKNATPSDRAAHIDIADWLIRWRQRHPHIALTSPIEQPPEDSSRTNPVFLEVKKYFSPEYHEEILALIEELDLEVVGAKKNLR